MLFRNRKRLAQLQKAEAKGQSFWTEELDEQVRLKIRYLVENLSDSIGTIFIETAQKITIEEEALVRLASEHRDSRYTDAIDGILTADTSVVLSLIEALMSLTNRVKPSRIQPYITPRNAARLGAALPVFIGKLSQILREHRIAFDIVERHFVPRQSRIMHENVIVPTLMLLVITKNMKMLRRLIEMTLSELHDGSPDDAITDASTALQEALSALRCEGNSLGPLANSAVVEEVIEPHDKKLIDWVSADRSTKGDAHSVSSALIEDAWLTVHVVGAIILRICGGPLRSSGEAR